MSDSDLATELQAGDDVGGYLIDEVIGTGGMGVVYAATHPLIGKRAAIKVMRAELSDDPGTVERFIREARVVNQIRHPNIVDIFAIGTLQTGQHYLIMDLLDGETLRVRLRRGPLDLVDALAVIDDTASALIAAHDQGVVHRDLKPDNVFLATRGQRFEVKLLDFGVAKLIGASASTLSPPTQAGVALGTPWYMSPEQARGRNVDHRTDIYALGVMAYETLTGMRPFDVLADGGDVIAAAAGSPLDLVTTISKMLDKAADRRPTLDLVRAAVKRAKRELRDSGPPAKMLEIIPTTIDLTDNFPTPPEERPPTHLEDDDAKTSATKPIPRARSPVFDGRMASMSEPSFELGAAGAKAKAKQAPRGPDIELGAAGPGDLDDGETRARKPYSMAEPLLELVDDTGAASVVPDLDLDDGSTAARLAFADDGTTAARLPFVDDGLTTPRPPVAIPQGSTEIALPGPPRPESVIDHPRAESVEIAMAPLGPPRPESVVQFPRPDSVEISVLQSGGTMPMPSLMVAPRPGEPPAPTEYVRAQAQPSSLPWRLIAFLVTLVIGGVVIFLLL